MVLLCFSHLRWDFVYQRPQHLMTRFAKPYDVYFIEEPVFYDGKDSYTLQPVQDSVIVVKPCLNSNDQSDIYRRLKKVTDDFINDREIEKFISWYYSPMALFFTNHLQPLLTVYDCMDELSAFKFAPAELKQAEQSLLQKADIVFTGGHSLYKAKKHLHQNIYSVPSSIDKEHFAKARNVVNEPSDQQQIPHPRLGFFGVIDERFDTELIRKAAEMKPEWQFILIGPVVKISRESLPTNTNIHYLGTRNYDELPEYLSGWDVALIPFAINESTRFISPTKTPEYLAAGKPVISTAIEDVIDPYGNENLVHIVHSPEEFIKAATEELNNKQKKAWLKKVDEFLLDNSWNSTWGKMYELINLTLNLKYPSNLKRTKIYV